MHCERKKPKGRVCKHHYSGHKAAQCAHIASSRDAGRLVGTGQGELNDDRVRVFIPVGVQGGERALCRPNRAGS